MSKKAILITGGQADNLSLVEQKIDKKKHNVTIAASVEEAIEKMYQHDIDLVILGAEISTADERKLRRISGVQNSGIEMLRFNDGDSASLNKIIDEILFEKDRTATFSFVDDAFKNASLNITIQ